MDFKKVIEWLGWNEIPPEFFTSILAMIIILVFALVMHFKLKNYDPLKKPSGFLNTCEAIVEFADKQVYEMMGPPFKGFGGYIICVGLYVFLSFFLGMIGIPNFLQPQSHTYLEALPNAFTNLAMPLSIALCTFGMTHFVAIKYKKRKYIERYLEPIPLFLPINLITMWSQVLSLTLRLFGNALAGYCVLVLIYTGLGTALPPAGSYTGFVLTPFIAPIAHIYFDIFDALIQLAVFCILTMINISGEYVSPEEYQRELEEERDHKLKKKEKKLEKKRLKEEMKQAQLGAK